MKKQIIALLLLVASNFCVAQQQPIGLAPDAYFLDGCGCSNGSITVKTNLIAPDYSQVQWFKDGQLLTTTTANLAILNSITSIVNPTTITVDANGNTYVEGIISSNGSAVQTKILKYARNATTPTDAGIIPLAGSGIGPVALIGNSLAVDKQGGVCANLSAYQNPGIVSYFAPGQTAGVTLNIPNLTGIIALTFDAAGRLYVLANTSTSSKTSILRLTGLPNTGGIAANKFTIETFLSNATSGYPTNTLGPTSNFKVDALGNMYVLFSTNSCSSCSFSVNSYDVIKVTPSNVVTNVVPNIELINTSATPTALDFAVSNALDANNMAIDGCGNIYLGDKNRIQKFTQGSNHAVTVLDNIHSSANGDNVAFLNILNDSLYFRDNSGSGGGARFLNYAQANTFTPTQAGVYTAKVISANNFTTTATGSITVAAADPTPSVAIQGDNIIPGGFVPPNFNAPVCAGTPVVFTATPTNAGATVNYTFYVNSANPVHNGSNNVFTLTNPHDQDSVTCVMTSTTSCGLTVVQSNNIKLTVLPVASTSVNIKADATTICQNQTVKFDTTNTITNGASIFEIDYSVLSNGVTTTFNNGQNSSRNISNLKNGDVVTATMYFINSNTSCYPTAVSNSITMSVVSSVTPTVNFQPLSSFYCSGKPIDFNVDATNTGTSPTFEFRKNTSTGTVLGTSANPSLLGVTGLANGDKVFCKMISNSTCQTTNITPAISPALVILNYQTASVTFDDPTGGVNKPLVQLCSNTKTLVDDTLKPSAFGADYIFQIGASDVIGNPISNNVGYLWKKIRLIHTFPNQYTSVTVSTNSQYQPTLASPLVDGDSLVCTVNLSSAGCFTNAIIVFKTKVNITAPTTSNLALKITAPFNYTAPTNNAADISTAPNYCSANTAPTFTASLVNSGINVSKYVWNITRNGAIYRTFTTNTNTYTPNSINTVLQDGDVVQCMAYPTTTCAPLVIASNSIKMSITAAITPTFYIGISNSGITNTITICSDSVVTFVGIPDATGYTPTYEWFINGISKSFSTNFQSTNFANGDVVTCKLTPLSGVGCVVNGIYNSRNSITVNVLASFGIGNLVLSPASNAVCIGNTYTLNASRQLTIGGVTSTMAAISGETYTFTFKKQILGTNIFTFQPLQSGSKSILQYKPTESGTITCTYKASSCAWGIVQKSIDVVVNPLPIVSAITGSNKVCVGSSITLTNTTATTGGTGIWSSIAGRATVSNIGIVTGVTTGTATIQYKFTDANTCSDSVQYNVAVNAIPAVPGIAFASGTSGVTGAGGYCKGKTFTLVGTPGNGVWSKFGIISINPAGTNSTTTVVNTGNTTGVTSVTYTYTDVNGCSNSRSISANIVGCRGIAVTNDLIATDFKLYPNPTHSTINLKIKNLIGAGSIVITDLYGKQLKQQTLSMGTNTIDVSTFAKGMYLLNVITESGKQTQKVVVE